VAGKIRGAGKPTQAGAALSTDRVLGGQGSAELELLSSHYEGCRAEIISLMQANERLLNLSILVLGGVYAYGIAQNITQLVALAPVAIAIAMLQGLQRYQLVHHLGGYKKYLEEAINVKLGRKVVFWEELCCVLYHKSWYNNCLRILYLFVAVLSAVEGTRAFRAMLKADQTPRPTLWVALYLLAVAVVALAIFMNFRRYRRSFDLGYSEATRLSPLAADPPPAS
jgi:hypothetical protein